MKNKKILLAIIILTVLEIGLVTYLMINRSTTESSSGNSNQAVCSQYEADNCPIDYTVCPPCTECSSISCQTEQFCQNIGFDDDWYDNLNSSGQKCELETCHGLDVQCGANPPDFCTEIYAIGDRCLQHAQCAIINGQCQLAEDGQFGRCRTCVEQCQKRYLNDNEQLFTCEQECG